MQSFYLPPRKDVPEIHFDASSGILNISGESYHEYTREVFAPVFEWLRQFMAVSKKNIEMNFHMNYFNTSTSRCFLEIIQLLEDYQKNRNGKVSINWFTDEDLDMMEAGREYAYDTTLPFNIIS